MKNDRKKPLTAEDLLAALDSCYQFAVKGIGRVSPSVRAMGQDYLDKAPDQYTAAKQMIHTQVAKCAASGFITGFGGFITLPVTVPANVGSVLYVQLRMIACTAWMAGFDPDSHETRALVYACLAGVKVDRTLSRLGAKFGEKVAVNISKKLPGSALSKIHRRVGLRLLAKAGEKGAAGLWKLVPGVGAAISGGFDLVETSVIGERAYHWFMKSDFSYGTEKDDEDDLLDVEDVPEPEQAPEPDAQAEDTNNRN